MQRLAFALLMSAAVLLMVGFALRCIIFRHFFFFTPRVSRDNEVWWFLALVGLVFGFVLLVRLCLRKNEQKQRERSQKILGIVSISLQHKYPLRARRTPTITITTERTNERYVHQEKNLQGIPRLCHLLLFHRASESRRLWRGRWWRYRHRIPDTKRSSVEISYRK